MNKSASPTDEDDQGMDEGGLSYPGVPGPPGVDAPPGTEETEGGKVGTINRYSFPFDLNNPIKLSIYSLYYLLIDQGII